MMAKGKDDLDPRGSVPPVSPDVKRLDVRTLLDGQKEVLLELNGQLYHLRITANGKLILTK